MQRTSALALLEDHAGAVCILGEGSWAASLEVR